MFAIYLKIALRNLLRSKGYSLVSIFGLAIGMACCILILLYVQHELTFDQSHENSSRIYRLVTERKTPSGISRDISNSPPLALALANDFPQITQSVRFLSIDNPTPLVSYGSARFYEKRLFFVDPNVFSIFTIPFLRGDFKTALEKPNSVVITEETARKYFGENNPLGKTLTLNTTINFEVTGVVQNTPLNSTVQFDFLTSFSTLSAWLGKDFVENWQNNSCQTYILLSEGASSEALTPQLPGFIEKHFGKENSLKGIFLQPLNRIHLYSFPDYGLSSGGDIQYVYLLSAVAVFILLIACINVMNLTTARLVLRSREVGIRKLIGASKKQLVQQFLLETLLLTSMASLIAVALVELGLPQLSAIIGKNLAGFYAGKWNMWLGPIGIVLLVSIVCGGYPAFVLSSLNAVHSLKGLFSAGSKRIFFRKALVVFQFALTIALMIGTGVIYNQLEFMRNKPLGFDKDQVIIAPIRDQSLRQNIEPLKSRLLQRAGILQVGGAALLPGGPVGKTRFRAQGVSETGTMSMLWVDYDFVKTLNIVMVAGRDFSKDFTTDASEAFILNEEAVKRLGWSSVQDAIGKSFELTGGKKGAIIGVVKDFNFVSLHQKIEPLVMHPWPWLNYVLVRADASHFGDVLNDMKNIWTEFEPSNPFTFVFLSDNFDRYYQIDKQLGQLFSYFALLAIVVACSGLFSLAAFTMEQRTKEIGIRKVLGASVLNIVGLLSNEFVTLVLMANVIAWPVAYYAMNRWLRDFAYRVDIGMVVFVFAGVLALTIALATVSYQAIKAALSNPVEALRYE